MNIIKITKSEFLDEIKSKNVFNDSEIAEIQDKIADISLNTDEIVNEWRTAGEILTAFGYSNENIIEDPSYLQLCYTIAVYRLKKSTLVYILQKLINKKLIEHEKSNP